MRASGCDFCKGSSLGERTCAAGEGVPILQGGNLLGERTSTETASNGSGGSGSGGDESLARGGGGEWGWGCLWLALLFLC